MSKPEPDPIYVRASVWGKCNLLCEYCPVEEGMENRVPSHLAGNLLTTDRYIRNMQSLLLRQEFVVPPSPGVNQPFGLISVRSLLASDPSSIGSN